MKKKVYLLLIASLAMLYIGCGQENTEKIEKQEFTENTEIIENVEEPLSEPEPVEEEERPTTEATILMVGDVLLHDRVELACQNDDGSYSFDKLFENVKEDIEAADIAIVNQEVIIGGKDLGVKGYPAFNAPFEVADDLAEAGFDVVCHGTNHALDKGGRGISNCLENWEVKHPDITILGIHNSEEDQNEISIIEDDKTGLSFAFLNYTYGTNGISLPDKMPYAVDYLSEERVISDLQKAEEIADFTIVCPHWGTEYSLDVDNSQKKWTKLMVKNGADLIIGTHPHVIEPYELYEDEESGNKALVYYSLGNFVNWTSGEGVGVSNRMVGGMCTVTIGVDEKQEPVIKEYDIIPIVSHVESGHNGVTVYKLDEYTAALGERNEIKAQASDFSYDYCKELVAKVWGK